MQGNIYNKPFRSHNKKKSIETSETIDALPSINRSQSHEKSNVVRNQLNDTKYKITQMEARLRNLKSLKDQFEHKHKHNLTKIQFMNGVKERIKNDQEHKNKVFILAIQIRQKRH